MSRPTRTLRWLRIVALLAFVGVAPGAIDHLGSARATAESFRDGEPEVGNADLDDYVKTYGASPEEARAHWAATDKAGELQAELIKTEGDVFGGLWIEREPTFAIVVGVLAGSEKAVQEHIDRFGLAEVARIQQVERTLADLRADQDAVRALIPPEIDYAVGVDQSEGRVKVFVETADDASVLANLRLPQSVAIIQQPMPSS